MSYLTIEESSAIKGTLMLLIILGHNHILAPINGDLFNYLYNFHIYGFFILPFLYNRKIGIEKKTLINGFIKLWIPYVFFFLLCYCIYHMVEIGHKIDVNEIIYGIFNANQRTIKKITGFGFLWFLPAYYIMSLLLIILNNRNILTYIIVTVLIVTLNYNLYYSENSIFQIIPFAVIPGLYYFTFGFLTKLLLDKISYIQYVAAGIFLIASILYWYNQINDILYIFPITGFLLIYSIKKLLSKFSIIIIIGKYSLPLYLIHIIVYNFFERLLPNEILFGLLNFLLTLTISMIIAYLMVRIEFIQKLVFPKNWNEFKSIFIH